MTELNKEFMRGFVYPILKWAWIIGITLAVIGLMSARAQAQIACPVDKVCITIEQARQALIDSDTVKAQKLQIDAQEKTIEGLRQELQNLRIELAKTVGDKTGAEQMIVRLTAIIDVLLKGQKKKCFPFSICIG